MNALRQQWPELAHGQETVDAQRLLTVAPKARILYADDDAWARRYSETVLGPCGYQVETVEDGEAAWEALHLFHYDLLVTDNSMPRLNGLELASKVRMAGITIPIVIASGSIEATRDETLDWLRIAAALPKPFSPRSLLRTVENVLQAPVLREFQQHSQPFPHWGINE